MRSARKSDARSAEEEGVRQTLVFQRVCGVPFRFTLPRASRTAGERGHALPPTKRLALMRADMESTSSRRLAYRRHSHSPTRAEGFSLLEMMMVVTLILIVGGKGVRNV
jgi:prepilin-type N-terminal cleavage/methylation domain-containing protein